MTDEVESLEEKVPWRYVVGLEHRLKEEAQGTTAIPATAASRIPCPAATAPTRTVLENPTLVA